MHAGGEPSELDRFLGTCDLYEAFETGGTRREIRWADGQRVPKEHETRRRPKYCDWAYAMLEMLLDPVLKGWVPQWIVEQYDRQNAHFRGSVRWALREKRSGRATSNKALLRLVYRRLVRKAKVRNDAEENDADSESEAAAGDGAVSAGTAPSGESGEEGAEESVRVELLEDARPDEDAVAAVEAAQPRLVHHAFGRGRLAVGLHVVVADAQAQPLRLARVRLALVRVRVGLGVGLG